MNANQLRLALWKTRTLRAQNIADERNYIIYITNHPNAEKRFPSVIDWIIKWKKIESLCSKYYNSLK